MRCLRQFSVFVRVAAAVFMACLGVSTQAMAHASLTGTMPADGEVVPTAPKTFSISFSEPVSPLTLRLIAPDGSVADLVDFTLRDQTVEIAAPESLDNGTHVLTWRVVSSDGHPVGGSVVFSVGEPSVAPPPVADPLDLNVGAGVWLTKLALYIGLFIGIGGVFAITWLLPEARPGARIVSTALGIGFIGTALSPGFQGLDALGTGLPRFFDPLVWRAGFETTYGRTVIAMVIAIICAVGALAMRERNVSRVFSLAGLAAGAGALALSGHASAAEPQWLTRPAVFLHATTIALWVGAILPLARALQANTRHATAGLRRFSTFIPFALTVLIAAGIILTAVQVQQPSALLDTAYGRLLLAKIALLVALFALAAHNRWKLTTPVTTDDAHARRRLVQSIMVETFLVLVIFGIASGWRFTPPPRSIAIAAAQPAFLHIHTNKAMADVTINPGRVGSVDVSAVIMTGDFGPLDAREVTFVFSNPQAGIEAFRRKAERPGDGTWRAQGVVLPLAGTWTVRVDILITDFEIARIQSEVQIRP